MKYYTYFGQAYGEGNYGEGTYSCTEEQQANGTCTTAAGGGTSGSGSSSGGGLADTGIAILALVTLACILIFVALVVRVWRRPKPVLQEVEVPRDDERPVRL